MQKNKEKFKVLMISDDYGTYLIKTGFYQEKINSCLDKETFDLNIKEEYPIGHNLNDYDFVLLDFGMVGNFTMLQVKTLTKLKELIIISALPASYIEKDEWYIKHFADRDVTEFETDMIGIFLQRRLIAKQKDKSVNK